MSEQSIQSLIDTATKGAQQCYARVDAPLVVVSPYRFNPLGAHIDHQGGTVLAQTINQYTVLAFYPTGNRQMQLACAEPFGEGQPVQFDIGAAPAAASNWQRYAMASVACFAANSAACSGIAGFVVGSMPGAGLSSSASVILAYLMALAAANDVTLDERAMVEMCRQVENEHMGLNNGVQDQMSIVFGQSSGLSILDVNRVSAGHATNPQSIDEVFWLVCYSGFSRELVSSGFNDRVRECREAASALDATASRLGDVADNLRTQQQIARLPAHLGRRARHVYSEMQRVRQGVEYWQAGNWRGFGGLMNTSCASSIKQYECGSEPMIDLHNIASQQPGIYGSRFSGGGYGGCLIMLAQRKEAEPIMQAVRQAYLERYPDKVDVARIFIAAPEAAVRLVD